MELLNYKNFKSHEEFIESLVKEQINCKEKKLDGILYDLGININKLKKFVNLEEVMPSIENDKMRNIYYKIYYPFYYGEYSLSYLKEVADYNKENTIYSNIVKLPYHYSGEYLDYNSEDCSKKPYFSGTINYVFKTILLQFSKVVEENIENIIKAGQSIEDINDKLNKYLKKNTMFDELNISYIPEGNIEEQLCQSAEFLKNTYKSKFSKWNGNILKITSTNEKLPLFYYPFWYNYDKLKLPCRYYMWRNHDEYINTRDIISLIALDMMAKTCFDYYNRDEYTKKNIIDEFKYSVYIDDMSDFISNLSRERFINDVRNNRYLVNSNMAEFLVVCMSQLIGEKVTLEDLKDKIKSSASSYATSFMTKKNIPKNIQNFMDNNEFLKVFSFVEADELCDLEKLRKIEEEFIELSNLIPIMKMETYSLRFRRLGRQKTLGIYYPIYRTMCVDIRSVSRFIHEYFHMLDYSLDMLSLDAKFKPLRDKAREIIQSYMNENHVSRETLRIWCSNNKYGGKYYLSNDEIFARLGEIYISEVLGIKTSFNKREFDKEIDTYLYKYDDTLFKMIKEYFDDLFEDIRKNHQIIRL